MYEELVKRLNAYSAEHECHGGITAEAADAIEELSREYESIAKSLTESVELVRKLKKPRWIPVTERLPKKWTWVLVCFDGADVPSTAFVNSTSNWIGEDMYTNYDVTHWMPLPKPPKETI